MPQLPTVPEASTFARPPLKRNQSSADDVGRDEAKKRIRAMYGCITVRPVLRKVPRIADFRKEIGRYPSPALKAFQTVVPAHEGDVFENDLQFVGTDSYVLGEVVFRGLQGYEKPEDGLPRELGPFYLRAGARREICFHPKDVKAAIVTCGGLCPGLNTVIRELVMCLSYYYGVTEIAGIPFGFRGFYDPKVTPMKLDTKTVSRIHQSGGSHIGAARGGFDRERVVEAIARAGYNHVYLIGGKETLHSAQELYEETRRRGMKVAVVGVPKTVDNDVPVVDRSFGFDTAVEEAARAIASAHVESHCAPNGVALVKLMGKSSGFIAMHAALASRDVNVCLVPEVAFRLEPLLAHLEARLRARGHATIVLAEGAGKNLPPAGSSADIGAFLRDAITKHFKGKGEEINVKYIDPTYMIRSVPANAADSTLCTNLAQNAVHGAMAGYTGFAVGLVNQKGLMLPLEDVQKPRTVDPRGRMWGRLLASTGQPDLY